MRLGHRGLPPVLPSKAKLYQLLDQNLYRILTYLSCMVGQAACRLKTSAPASAGHFQGVLGQFVREKQLFEIPIAT